MGPRQVRRLPRAARREQILTAATGAFAHAGYTATGLDEVAVAAGVSRAILYRHFTSKSELYRAVLDRARTRVQAAVGDPPYTERIIDDLLRTAAGDPDGFRVLFAHAVREPAFRGDVDAFTAEMAATARDQLAASIPNSDWAQWAAHLAPTVTIAAALAWLDAGRPDPDVAAIRIREAVRGVTAAASLQAAPTPDHSSDARASAQVISQDAC